MHFWLKSHLYSSGERELIASYVSYLNECEFCHLSHSAAANAHLGDNGKTVSCIIENIETADISEKLKQLLKIAGKVQKSGKLVTKEDIDAAKLNGAIDEEIHDTVLIAAAFCMFNRYVDGLGTTPAPKEEYPEMGRRMAKGYKMPPNFLKKFILKLINKKSDSGAIEHMKNTTEDNWFYIPIWDLASSNTATTDLDNLLNGKMVMDLDALEKSEEWF